MPTSSRRSWCCLTTTGQSGKVQLLPFGAGCHSILYGFAEAERDHPRAVIGFTDITVRKPIGGHLMAILFRGSTGVYHFATYRQGCRIHCGVCHRRLLRNCYSSPGFVLLIATVADSIIVGALWSSPQRAVNAVNPRDQLGCSAWSGGGIVLLPFAIFSARNRPGARVLLFSTDTGLSLISILENHLLVRHVPSLRPLPWPVECPLQNNEKCPCRSDIATREVRPGK